MNTEEAFAVLRKYFPDSIFYTSVSRVKKREYNEAADILESVLKLQRDRIELLERSGQVSEEFRKMPNKRWEGSYTKKCIDILLMHITPARHERLCARGHKTALAAQALIDLLKDYHSTMHVVYEERDAARENLKKAQARIVSIKTATLAQRFGTGPSFFQHMDVLGKFTFPTHGIVPVPGGTVDRLTKERDEALANVGLLIAQNKATADQRDRAAKMVKDRESEADQLQKTLETVRLLSSNLRKEAETASALATMRGRQIDEQAGYLTQLANVTKEREILRAERDQIRQKHFAALRQLRDSIERLV